MDNRKVEWKLWAPNQKHMNERGRYHGRDKCVSMYKNSGYWYHQRCSYRNGVVCEKPHGKFVGEYVIIQKEYRYKKAKKLCQQWYVLFLFVFLHFCIIFYFIHSKKKKVWNTFGDDT